MAFVQHVGDNRTTTSGTTLTVTVPAGGIPAGHTLLVGVLAGSGLTSASVTDTGGNTYAEDVSAVNSLFAKIFSAPITTALNAGDTITLTTNSISQRGISVDEFDTGLTLDKTATGTGNDTAPTAGPVTTTSADEILYATFACANLAGGFTAGGSFTGTAHNELQGRAIDTEYQEVAATGSYSGTGTYADAATWTAVFATYAESAGGGSQTINTGHISTGETVRGAGVTGSGSATVSTGHIASGATVRGADLQPQPVTLAIGKIATGEAVRGADMISGFAADTFTDADNTLLSAHTGEIGATWTKHPQSGGGDMKVSGNRLAGSVAADYSFYTPSGTPAGADYDVQATLRTNGDTASVAAVMGRFDTTALTGYRAMYSGFSGTWVLSKFVAGSQVDLGTYAVAATADTDYDVKLEMRGSAIKVYIDGVERISVTDSAVTAAGTAGVEIYSTGITLDSFVAVDAVVTALTISTGHIASGATVRGADPAGSGSATLATGKIATGAAVRGASVAGSGSVTVSTGHIASGATVRGASPAGSGSATLTVGRITSGAAVRGVSVAGSGSATLATGHISSVATVRGADVTFSALSLAVGKVSSGATVRGADVTAGTATIHVGHITAGGRPFGVHLSVKLLDAVTERRMQIDWRRAGRRDRRRRFQ